ncbi:hypothetical protein F5882DRAFT_465352 [Hyaloscypha sp. PMI_1271]|nr:hypothetical protein F5882DRAFT_465352 [Hyaloscypha sp. PMI_1271]
MPACFSGIVLAVPNHHSAESTARQAKQLQLLAAVRLTSSKPPLRGVPGPPDFSGIRLASSNHHLAEHPSKTSWAAAALSTGRVGYHHSGEQLKAQDTQFTLAVGNTVEPGGGMGGI